MPTNTLGYGVFLTTALSILLFPFSGFAAPPAFSDRAVEESIDKGVTYLWGQQQKDGSFPPTKTGSGTHPVGYTALAAYALLESGVRVEDPRMDKTLKWLIAHDTDGVYDLGVRCNVWLAAEIQKPGQYWEYLRRDGWRLATGLYKGGYHYKLGDQFAHNSAAQYGVLGVWAYERGRGEVHSNYWRAVMDYWLKGQNADGGWGYDVTFLGKPKAKLNRPTTHAAMVPAGVASLFLCFDSIEASKFITCTNTELPEPIRRGLAWFDKNFLKSLTDPKFPIGWENQYNYYLYGVERVGLAAGYKYFGKVNWYKEGAVHIIRRQEKDGKWSNKASGTISETSFALLFLIRGRHPVVFNKLQRQGDWNNRPRDLAFLTAWMSRTFERSLNWQIVNLDVDVGEWNDAPILYIAGAQKPVFSDTDLQKLREYVFQGGTIFSVTECEGKEFASGIREVYRRLFPQYELVPLDKSHDLYNRRTQYDLPETCRLEVLSNGVRPLAVHTDEDLAKLWQLQSTATGAYAFQAAANVFMYATEKGKLPHRGTNHWPDPVALSQGPVIRLARLAHNGNPNPEPLADERFARLMAGRCGVRIETSADVPATELVSKGIHLAILSGTGDFTLGDDQVAALKKFLADGGTLMIEATGGVKYQTDQTTGIPRPVGFAIGAERLIAAMYGQNALRRMATLSPIYSLKGKEIKEVTYRGEAKIRLGSSRTPNLWAVMIGDRPALLYSREDLTHALLGARSLPVDGYEPESAFDLMRNIALNAAGNERPN